MTYPILGADPADLRRDRTSVKWRAYPEDVLPLWIAEMDCTPCPSVVEAVSSALRRGDTGYAWTVAYAEAFTSFAAAQWNWQVNPNATTKVADVLTGIARLIEVLTEPGGPVVVSSPVYHAFYTVIDSVGRVAVDAPLTDDGRLDGESLAAAFSAATRGGQRAVYLLANPHNPTGAVHTPDELAALARLADEHGVTVVSDEIHAPLVHAPAVFTPYLSVPGAERGITVTSASKAWNLAGLKAAIVVPGPESVAMVRRLHPFVTYGASHLGAIAQTAAWSQGSEWLGRLLVELDANRRLLADLVAEQLPGVRMLTPEATYLAWLDFRPLGLDDDPAVLFRERGRVALSGGPEFGPRGVGCARVNFGTSPEILREAVRRMASALD